MATPFRPGTAGSGLEHIFEAWQGDIEGYVYEGMAFVPLIEERDRPYSKLHVRKLSGTFSASTLSSTENGDTLSYGTATTSQVNMTPTRQYVAFAVQRSQLNEMEVDPLRKYQSGAEAALAAQIDVSTLSDVATITGTVLGNNAASWDRTLYLNALSALRNATPAVEPGDSDIWSLIWPNQIASVMSIPEITSANLRGDSQNPNVRGMVMNGLGIKYRVTGNLTSDASGIHNPLFVKSAFGIGWNERPTVEHQKFEAQDRIYVFCNYAHAVIWDARCADIRTKTGL